MRLLRTVGRGQEAGSMTSPVLSELGRVALGYAANGRLVFPLSPRSKAPLRGSNGWKEATREALRIRAWWTEEPHANIGLRLGPESDLIVADFDKRHDGQLEARGLELPETLTVRTGSGRRHVYFTWDDRLVGLGAVVELPVCELRLQDCCVLLPPSVHPFGEQYRCEAGTRDAVQAPEWLIDMALEHGRTAVALAPEVAQRHARSWYETGIEGELDKIATAPEGTRNQQLFTSTRRA